MKKILVTAMVAALATGTLLTGCDSRSSSSASDQSTNQMSQTTEQSEGNSEADAQNGNPDNQQSSQEIQKVSMEEWEQFFPQIYIPDYDGKTYNIILNNNQTYFSDEDMNLEDGFYYLSDLDDSGRCGYMMAVASSDTMATEGRPDMSYIHPTGWESVEYEGIVDAEPAKLYNRSHLGMFAALDGLFDTCVPENLITGTRFFNADEDYGMQHYETEMYTYIKYNDNHVLYRVTPVFVEDELVARGVIMEAKSMEDDGESLEYCVFVYNVQPSSKNGIDESDWDGSDLGVYIDYATGENHLMTADEWVILDENNNVLEY